MGDRTYVTVTVLKEHAEEAKKLIDPQEGDPEDESEDDDLVELGYSEVNYGTIDALDGFARLGIPFLCHWNSGSNYGEGYRWVQFDAVGQAVPGCSNQEWPEVVLDEFRTQIKEASSVEQIQALLEQSIAAQSWDSWEDQLEHSKIARTRNLLNPQ